MIYVKKTQYIFILNHIIDANIIRDNNINTEINSENQFKIIIKQD